MPVPRAEPGLVIRYNYLWRRDADRGRDTSKSRPACIVAALAARDGEIEIVVLPITHTKPGANTPAIEIPPSVKAHLGLDEERSWAVLTECNIDLWPSPDLAPLPGKPGVFAYGFLPPKLFRRIRDGFVDVAKAKRLRLVRREDS